MIFEIPIQPSMPQTFIINLPGGAYRFTLQWRDYGAQCWCLDIADTAGNSIVAGVPLVTGTSDLLSQFTSIDLGGQLVVQTDGTAGGAPTFDSLGSTSHLYFVTP